MRRGLASLIIGLSLIVASLSWASFTLSRTVLDPGRSERLADQLLENENVRQALVVRMADALETQIPSDVAVPRGVLEAGAATALDDPRVEALIRDGFVQVHQNALNGVDEPVTVDASALGAAGRDVLVELRPELESALPPTPPLQVELPTTGLSWLGSVKNFVDRFTGISALVAVCGAGLAFVVAKNRAKVLRRVAFWGYGASAFWLILAYAVPWLAGTLSPTSAAIASAATDVFFGAMIQPAIMMAVMATALLVASFLLPAFKRRQGAAKLQPRRAAGPAGGVVAGAAVVGAAGRVAAPIQPPPTPQAPTAPRQPTQAMPIAVDRPARPTPTAIQPPPTVRATPPATAGASGTNGAPRGGSLTDAARPAVNTEPSVLFGPDQGPTIRVNPDQPPSPEPWLPRGSTDSTDQMPIPDWAKESEQQQDSP